MFTDHNGFRKRRPAIILTPTDQIAQAEKLVLMAITTTFPDPPPANHIPLPWFPDPRKSPTGLARRSAAVIDWLEVVSADDILSVRGQVPGVYMNRIQEALRAGP
jgi:hypothetical protein